MRNELREKLEEMDFQSNVPAPIKKRASLIAFRFGISGICDPMYISNVIAYAEGVGDGESHFKNVPFQPKRTEKTADSLLSSYGCNIKDSDKDELVSILATGKLDREKTLQGILDFITGCRDEIAEIKQKRDWTLEWRIPYLRNLQENMRENYKVAEAYL